MTIHGNHSPGRWRKSSYSGNNGDCVEIGVVELRPTVGIWRKSSRSNGGEACVEVSVTGAGQVPGGPTASAIRVLAVRDSKDPAGPRLHFTPSVWAAFAGALKAGS